MNRCRTIHRSWDYKYYGAEDKATQEEIRVQEVEMLAGRMSMKTFLLKVASIRGISTQQLLCGDAVDGENLPSGVTLRLPYPTLFCGFLCCFSGCWAPQSL